jgi:hypothetical protein
VVEIASRDPDAVLLVLSESYLRALLPDIRLAAEALGRSNRLTILCCGSRARPLHGEGRLPCDARLRRLVGGSLTTLNVRLAARLLEALEPAHWDRERFDRTMKGWMQAPPAAPRPPRLRRSDAEIRTFIADSLGRDPSASPLALLGRLRGQGQACGQERFERLYQQVRR